MGPAITEVYSTLAAQDIKPSGACFIHHTHRPRDVLDFDVCFRVAHTVYHGNYDKLGDAWGEFIKWVEANEHCRVRGVERVNQHNAFDP